MIKKYAKSDFAQLNILIKKYNCEIDEPPLIYDFYNSDNLSSDFDCFVLAEKNNIYGFITGQKLNKNDYLLLDIYVSPEKRNQGFALKLAEKLIKNAKNYNRILSNPENNKSISLLEKIGFKELPDNEKNKGKKGKHPYFTHYYLN